MSHFRSWEMVVPRNLFDSTAATVLFMMVSGWSAGGFLLKSTIISTFFFERVELQVVVTASDSQLLNLLSVNRLLSILDKADDCSVVRTLQELDRGDFRCAVICVKGEEQWGDNTSLRGASADGESSGCEFC